eukprot:12044988-Prorocentrum_lima.AAC.1
MEPTTQLWMYIRGPENKPMWMRADGSTRITSPYKVELPLGEDDHPYQDFIDIEEATPLIVLKDQYQARGAELVA